MNKSNNVDVLNVVLREELESVALDSQRIFDEMKTVLNTHAEVLGHLRHILEKFVPEPMLRQATKEYYELRKAQIESQNAPQSPDTAN